MHQTTPSVRGRRADRDARRAKSERATEVDRSEVDDTERAEVGRQGGLATGTGQTKGRAYKLRKRGGPVGRTCVPL
jgi:hypothetical protein